MGLLKGDSRLLNRSGSLTAFRKSRVVGLLCRGEFVLRLFKGKGSLLSLLGIRTVLFNGGVVRKLCRFNTEHCIFNRTVCFLGSISAFLESFVIGDLGFLKVKLCSLCFGFSLGEFIHIHRSFTDNIGNRSHRFDVFRHGLCERFGRDVHKFGGIHILLELIGCDACLRCGGENTVSVSSTLGCHIHKGFSGSHGGSGNGSEGSGYNGCGCLTSRTKPLEGGTGFIGFLGCIVDFLTKLIGCFACILHTLAGVFDGIVIALKLTFHTVEGSFSII